jgi:hypothetical protein
MPSCSESSALHPSTLARIGPPHSSVNLYSSSVRHPSGWLACVRGGKGTCVHRGVGALCFTSAWCLLSVDRRTKEMRMNKEAIKRGEKGRAEGREEVKRKRRD